MFREFDPASRGNDNLDVPDPYYGGEDGFDHVLDLVEAAAEGLVTEARAWT
jgi:protein-tyrosine phosphatase